MDIDGESERISEIVDNMIDEDQKNLHHETSVVVDVTNNFITDEVTQFLLVYEM